MIDKQQFYTCNNICLKLLLIYAKYFENSVLKLFLNGEMNICLILGKQYFRFQGWNSYIRTILSASRHWN